MALLRLLHARFGDPLPNAALEGRLAQVKDPAILTRLVEVAAVGSLAQVEAALPPG